MPIDQLQLSFDPRAVQVLNAMLATVVFGAALDVRIADFVGIVASPKGPLIGALSQFVLLPALASLIVWLLQPAPSIALGIMLVAACPGGVTSNFLTMLARGNVALSISISAFSTLVAMVMTPFNFTFWGRLNPVTSDLLREIAVDPMDILWSAFYMLIVPTIVAMAVQHWRPALASRLLRPVRVLGVGLLLGLVAWGLVANFRHFLDYIGLAFFIVLIVNGSGLTVGYFVSWLAGLSHYDAKAVSIETGLQNTGFGLVLVFNFFGGLGGMALIAAWWSVWHLVTGLGLALLWARMSATPSR
jgi:bile acid:Na+ symporter, BASS family